MNFEVETSCRIALALIGVTLGAIGLPRRIRADRVGGSVSPRVDPGWFWPLMLIVAPAVALVCLAFVVEPRWVEFGRVAMPAGFRLTGIPIGIGGLALFAWTFRHLDLNVTSTSMPRREGTLVTTGPYRWIRHPMYSTVFILTGAAGLLSANAVVWIGGIATFVLLAARSRAEERRLAEKFGREYALYRRRTGRFLPRVGPPPS